MTEGITGKEGPQVLEKIQKKNDKNESTVLTWIVFERGFAVDELWLARAALPTNGSDIGKGFKPFVDTFQVGCERARWPSMTMGGIMFSSCRGALGGRVSGRYNIGIVILYDN